MAGRPAARGGGLTGVHYSLIAFIAVSVLALGAFIFQLTQNGRLLEEAQRLQAQMDQWGSPPSFYLNEARQTNGRAVALMNRHLSDYALMTVGDPDASFAAAKLQADQVRQRVATQHADLIRDTTAPLSVVTQRLSGELADVMRRTRATETELRDARDLVAALEGRNRLLSEQFTQEINRLQEQVTQIEETSQASLDEKEAQRTQLEEQLTQASQALQQMRIDLERGTQVKDQQITQLQGLVDELRNRITEIQPPEVDPYAILNKADGRVVRAIPGADVVYISLGANDGVRVGMTFEVYGQDAPPRGLRGKASIEVATVLPAAAECLVTRSTPARPIIPDDPIVNLAYEPGRSPRFLVRGDFDLDYDGVVDANGVSKINALIRQWGGVVADEFDETIDYVVVGSAPFVPEARPGRVITPTVIAQEEQLRLERTAFRDVVQQANNLYIPVLTQSQFLFLSGFTPGQLARP